MLAPPSPQELWGAKGLADHLNLPVALTNALRLTPEEFAELCAANPDAVLELAADGSLIQMTPTGSATGARNADLLFQVQSWARARGGWKVFDSSTGFCLPDGSVRSPDASLVALERWQALSADERRGFAPLCPDLVVELASPKDDGPRGVSALRQKMASYQRNGARLGWLLIPEKRAVEVWPAAGSSSPLEGLIKLEGGADFPGLCIDLEEIWAT